MSFSMSAICFYLKYVRYRHTQRSSSSRAGLNEREATPPSKVVTARPPKRLVRLCSVSHALVSFLQKRFTCPRFNFADTHWQPTLQRYNWWPCTAVRMWLICSTRKMDYKKTICELPWHCTTIFFITDSLTIFTAQIVHSHVHWGKICLRHWFSTTVLRATCSFQARAYPVSNFRGCDFSNNW